MRDAHDQITDDLSREDDRSFQEVLEDGVGRKQLEEALAFANTKLSAADKETMLELLKQ